MPIYLFETNLSTTPNITVVRDTIRYNASLGISGDAGTGGQQNLSFTLLIDAQSSVKPKTGNFVKWVGDDGFNRTYFSGIISHITKAISGFNELGKNVWVYDVTARDGSYLFDKLYINAGALFSSSIASFRTDQRPTLIGNTLTSNQVVSGTFVQRIGSLGISLEEANTYGLLLDFLAQAADYRIKIASGNEGYDLFVDPLLEVSTMTLGQLIDQLASEAGLVWWVDENFRFHHKKVSTLLQTNSASSFFNINTNSKNYYALELNEDYEGLSSRVLVEGNFFDPGIINTVNRIDGVQRFERIYDVVSSQSGYEQVISRQYPNLRLNQNITDILKTNNFGVPGILMHNVVNTNSYFEDLNSAQNFLNRSGEEYLATHSEPLVLGTVNYHDQAPSLGQSITVHLPDIGLSNRKVIVTSISMSGGADNTGNDSNGNRKYTYSVGFGEIPYADRFKHRNGPSLRAGKDSRNIKPNPPTFYNVVFTNDGPDTTLLFGLNAPVTNAPLDTVGFPQPATPVVYVAKYECRVTANPNARFNPEDPQVFWNSYSTETFIPEHFLTNQKTGFEPISDLVFEQDQAIRPFGWRISYTVDAEQIYYQVRSITKAGEVSDWTSVRSIRKGDSKDENDNDVDPVPGILDNISEEIPAGMAGSGNDPCCPSTPVAPAPAPPPPSGFDPNNPPTQIEIEAVVYFDIKTLVSLFTVGGSMTNEEFSKCFSSFNYQDIGVFYNISSNGGTILYSAISSYPGIYFGNGSTKLIKVTNTNGSIIATYAPETNSLPISPTGVKPNRCVSASSGEIFRPNPAIGQNAIVKYKLLYFKQ